MRRNRTLDKPRYRIIINLIILTTSNETPSQTNLLEYANNNFKAIWHYNHSSCEL